MLKCTGSVLALCIALTCVTSAAPDFEALGRETVAELSAGAFDTVVARFDQKMTAALPREKLAAAWQTIVGQVGAFKSVTAVRLQDVSAQGVHVVELTSAFEKGPLNIRLAFN